MTVNATRYKGIVIGCSAGGVAALEAILPAFKPGFGLPVLVVQHLHPGDGGSLPSHLGRVTGLPVAEPGDKEVIEPGRVYTAPANYHMLVERDGTIGLSVDERVNWSRPSIDVLFESAALAWGAGAIAALLSGANADGVRGLRAIRDAGGLTFAQDPAEAGYPAMPQAAIAAGAAGEILKAAEIGSFLAGLRA